MTRRRPKPCFLVLESYWSEDLTERESVHPFIKGLCDLNLWEFHYRTFDSANDLRLWITNFNRIRRARAEKILYLASHGSTAGRLWTLEQTIPLRSLLRIVKQAKSVVGLHLGSCNLGKSSMVKKLLTDTSLQWVASYDREVPWMESTVLDLLFWSWMYAGAPRARRSRRLTPESAAQELYSRFNYARDMGFQVLYREPGSGRVVSSRQQAEAGTSESRDSAR